MSRHYTVRLWDGTSHDIDLNSSENFFDFTEKVSANACLDEGRTIRFLCKGKIINSSNFHKLSTGSMLLAMTTRKSSEHKTINDINPGAALCNEVKFNNAISNDNIQFNNATNGN